MLPNYFTSNFIEKSPNSLRESYNQRFIKSLLSLLNTVERGLKKNYAELKRKIHILNPNEKLHPMLHFAHASLADALRNNNAIDVAKLIVTLTQIIDHHPYAPLFGIRTISSDPCEQAVLESLKEQNRNLNGKLPSIDFVDDEQIAKYSPIITNSLLAIKKASPLFYDEFESYVTEIKLFNSDRLVGMTDPRLFGSVYISISNNDLPSEVYFCEHLIHEISHLHLYTLFAQDRLILNDPNERYAAPIRPDPRPMYGIFHATFVLSRMVRIFHQLEGLFGNPSYSKCLATFQKQFHNGYTTVINHGKLTPYGQKIMQSYSDLIAMQG